MELTTYHLWVVQRKIEAHQCRYTFWKCAICGQTLMVIAHIIKSSNLNSLDHLDAVTVARRWCRWVVTLCVGNPVHDRNPQTPLIPISEVIMPRRIHKPKKPRRPAGKSLLGKPVRPKKPHKPSKPSGLGIL